MASAGFELFQDLSDLAVVASDVTGTGGTDSRLVAGADMASGEQGHDRHSGCGAGRHPDRMILDQQALLRLNAEGLRHHEVDVRIRLASREAGGAEHSVAEMMAQAEPLQRSVEPFPIARRGYRQKAVRPPLEERLDPLDRKDVGDPGGDHAVDALPKRRKIDCEPAVGLDRPVAVAPSKPGIALDRLFGRDGVAERGQRFGEGGVGDHLAVDDDAVEIEDDGVELQRRSPNKAVPTRTWVAPIATAVS